MTKIEKLWFFVFNQGSQLRKELENVTVDILGVADSGLFIAQVVDVKTGSVNDLITTNRNLRITGGRLKIAGDNPANGVYFINQTTNLRTKVEESDIVTNVPSEVMVVIPDLLVGTYQVEVTTQYGGNSKHFLKEPRTAVFDKILTVA